MSEHTTITLPRMPDCWESCGNCADEDIVVASVLVQPGDRVERDQPIITIESDKTVLDVPSPASGRVALIYVSRGESIMENDPILELEAS
jgi:pyruvate/2-oxoglutarate dehydrogenase complex dihydrolipoamide acyltransferase (E2) component